MKNIQLLIGQRIKELRNEIGISQEKFALQIEMDRTYFASVETGKRNISIINLEKILRGLHISFSDFFSTIDSELNRRNINGTNSQK